MSEDIYVSIMRGTQTTPIANNVFIQLDKMSSNEAASYQGSDPHFTYKAYTTTLSTVNPILVLFRDYMVDLNVIDPITDMYRRYLIVNDPECHTLDSHWQWVCTRVRGT